MTATSPMDALARATSAGSGSPPAAFAALIPELDVSDLSASLWFWTECLGFAVAYDRPAAGFAFLTRGSAQLMLCARNGRWETGELARPFDRGVNFQIMVEQLEPILDALTGADWPLFEAPSEAWYRTGDVEGGQREFLVQDPDGYLLRFAQDLGHRMPG